MIQGKPLATGQGSAQGSFHILPRHRNTVRKICDRTQCSSTFCWRGVKPALGCCDCMPYLFPSILLPGLMKVRCCILLPLSPGEPTPCSAIVGTETVNQEQHVGSRKYVPRQLKIYVGSFPHMVDDADACLSLLRFCTKY